VIALEPARVGRDGGLRLGFERRGGATVLARCRSTVPLQVMAPVALDDPAAVVSVLNPTGGLAGGDRLTLEVAVGPGAHACITTPSATRVYRTDGEPSRQDVRISVGEGAVLEWVPDHTIPFPGADFRQRTTVDLAAGARLILIDAFAAGRVACGEAWRFRHLESALTVRDSAGWRFLDRFRLEAGPACDLGSAPGAAEGHPYFATLIAAGEAVPPGLGPRLTAAAARPGQVVAAAGELRRGGVVLRVLGRAAPEFLAALDAAWRSARDALLGLPPLDLRKG
jgi:urease accessory protein